MADADDQRIGQFVSEDVHQRQCGFAVEQDLQPAVEQDFFDLIAAYGVSDGIFTFTEQVCGISCRLCGNFGYGGGRCYNNGLFLKVDIMEATVYLEDNEYIALCDLLKLAGLAESGGQAKAFIAEGLVLRNGETETRKTAKIRGGEVIEFDGARLEIADGYDPEA